MCAYRRTWSRLTLVRLIFATKTSLALRPATWRSSILTARTLDSGTVVEFVYAKLLDIPAVILRTDFRGGGDQDTDGDAWNLMVSFYPRTRNVTLERDGVVSGRAPRIGFGCGCGSPLL